MEKFLNWGNDFSDIGEGFDDCQRDDIRERAKNYFSDRKEAYSDTFDDLVQRGKAALEDEETREIIKIILIVIIFIILICIIAGAFRRKR